MLNSITIMGRLTRDPELRRTGSGVVSYCLGSVQSARRSSSFAVAILTIASPAL